MNRTQFETILHQKQPVHLIGIGGVSMRALARMLKYLGANVQGSDRDASVYTEQLIEAGITVFIGHRTENVFSAAQVIRTAAIPATNPEMIGAVMAGIPILSRAEAWGLIMTYYQQVVCVAGTHGKTTTTAMIATFTQAAELDPTVMVGGDLASIGGTLRIGHSPLFVAEACEYRNSFLSFCPSLAVILNIDRDHLDFFKDTEDIIASFRKFALLTPENGTVLINGDDKNSRKAVEDLPRRIVTFGLSHQCDIHPEHIETKDGLYHCDVMAFGRLYCCMRLSVPGQHNLLNSMAAAAVAFELGVDSESFAKGIQQYTGVGRRLEFKKVWRGARIFDDYAHHPNEIKAALTAARSLTEHRVICVFQPHTYSRTASLLDEFASALSLADKTLLCPIYAAREVNTFGVSSEDLAKRMLGAECVPDFDHAAHRLEELVQPGDLIFTMGAGNVYQIAELLN